MKEKNPFIAAANGQNIYSGSQSIFHACIYLYNIVNHITIENLCRYSQSRQFNQL